MDAAALDSLQLTSLASGAHAILLTERIGWEEFPGYVAAFAQMMRVRVTDQGSSGDTRIATVEIEGQRFWLAYDVWQNGVSLEPQSDAAAALVPSIYSRLLRLRQDGSE